MKIILAGLFLLIPVTLSSQVTHPCDNAPTQGLNAKSPFNVGVCWDQKNTNGDSVTATRLKVFIDGFQKSDISNPQPVGSANAQGLYYYRVSGVSVTSSGNHKLTFSVGTADGDSAQSDPYLFTIGGGTKASTPIGGRVEPQD